MKKQPSTTKNDTLNSAKKVSKPKKCENCSGKCKQFNKLENK